MSPDQVALVASPTAGEPTKIEVHKHGRVIGRILHVGELYEFHKGMNSFALNEAAQFSDLDELKKWIGETQ